MKWADPTLPILYRKVMFIVYIITIVIFLLLFLNYKREEQYNFYSAGLFVNIGIFRVFYWHQHWEDSKMVPT